MGIEITFHAGVREATEQPPILVKLLFGEQVRQSYVSSSLSRLGHSWPRVIARVLLDQAVPQVSVRLPGQVEYGAIFSNEWDYE